MSLSSPLLFADSARNADLRYFGKVLVSDPFIAFGVGKKKVAAFSALEIDRAKTESVFTDIVSLEHWLANAKAAYPDRKAGAAEIIALLAKHFGVSEFTVTEDFPTGVFLKLQQLGLKLEVVSGMLFPKRETKSEQEIKFLREGNRCSARGIAAAEGVLKKSKIKAGKLFYQNKPLTSERLKLAIETACLEAGAVSIDTIAAGGDQACDPHCRGHGPLRAHELIIVDVFPYVNNHGYYGDMTRTFLKGKASDLQSELVGSVRAAQKLAMKNIRAGVAGRAVHEAVSSLFKVRGYETKQTASGWGGFFHGTGHGVGLAIHEAPRMSASSEAILKKGSVVTVEPGLYYRGLGGCRIEDVVQVTEAKPRLLSSYHYEWELR